MKSLTAAPAVGGVANEVETLMRKTNEKAETAEEVEVDLCKVWSYSTKITANNSLGTLI